MTSQKYRELPRPNHVATNPQFGHSTISNEAREATGARAQSSRQRADFGANPAPTGGLRSDSMKTLDQLISDHRGKVMDKWASYIQEYEHLFARFRNQPIVLLEVGVQNGGSLELWNEYLHSAKAIIGCDINPECATLQFATDRIHLLIGDANDEQCARQIATISPGLDIIIDDGSHTSKDVIGVFSRYFPLLKSDGLYVIEDLHCSYWREYEGGLLIHIQQLPS
jgi:Methyltransferase domain